MSCPSCGQESCSCQMPPPYQICRCNITSFYFLDPNGNSISQVCLGQPFQIVVDVQATSGVARVLDAGTQSNSPSFAIPLDDASFLWDPDHQTTRECVLSSNQIRIQYDHVAGNWLYGINAYAYDGSPINSGYPIFGGQIVEFRDPTSMLPLSSTVKLEPVINVTDRDVSVALSVTSKTLDSGDIFIFDDETLSGNVTHCNTIEITASYYPSGTNTNDYGNIRCSQVQFIDVVTTTTTTTTTITTTTTTTSTTTTSTTTPGTTTSTTTTTTTSTTTTSTTKNRSSCCGIHGATGLWCTTAGLGTTSAACSKGGATGCSTASGSCNVQEKTGAPINCGAKDAWVGNCAAGTYHCYDYVSDSCSVR